MAIKKTISLGLISIPVQLQKTFTSNKISFSLVDKKSNEKVHYIKQAGNKKIDKEDVSKAIKHGDQFVNINEEELKDIKKEDNLIAIVHFCLNSEIPSMLNQRLYYLTPVKGSERPFALLHQQLKGHSISAVVKVSGKNKEELALITVINNIMYLNVIYYYDEINDPPIISSIIISKEEKQLAAALIKKMMKKFDHKKYQDEVNVKIKKLVNQKVNSVKPKKRSKEKINADALNLMAALSKSMNNKSKSI